MKSEKSNKKTYAQPRMDEVDDRRSRNLVGVGLFLCYCMAFNNNRRKEMERILKALDEVGMTIKKTEDGDYILMAKEEK